MQQIAEAAGVSATTVSHAISGKRPVGAETARRIRRLIDEHGYVPDAAGRRLRTGRSRMLGLAIPDLAAWFFARIAKGVEEVADARDHGLIVCSTAGSDPRREQRCFELVRTRAIDGLVYTAGRRPADLGGLRRIAEVAPLVLADEVIDGLDGVPAIASDNETGAAEAARHLRALGHERVVVLAGVPGLRSTIDRTAGARAVFPHALVLAGDFEQESGARLTGDLLESGTPFTAILAQNDLMAIGAIRRLAEAGLRVPEDVSVVGFDDIGLASFVEPGLTTVRQDVVEMGRRAASVALDAIEGAGSAAPPAALLPVELVVRGSTGRARERP